MPAHVSPYVLYIALTSEQTFFTILLHHVLYVMTQYQGLNHVAFLCVSYKTNNIPRHTTNSQQLHVCYNLI